MFTSLITFLYAPPSGSADSPYTAQEVTLLNIHIATMEARDDLQIGRDRTPAGRTPGTGDRAGTRAGARAGAVARAGAGAGARTSATAPVGAGTGGGGGARASAGAGAWAGGGAGPGASGAAGAGARVGPGAAAGAAAVAPAVAAAGAGVGAVSRAEAAAAAVSGAGALLSAHARDKGGGHPDQMEEDDDDVAIVATSHAMDGKEAEEEEEEDPCIVCASREEDGMLVCRKCHLSTHSWCYYRKGSTDEGDSITVGDAWVCGQCGGPQQHTLGNGKGSGKMISHDQSHPHNIPVTDHQLRHIEEKRQEALRRKALKAPHVQTPAPRGPVVNALNLPTGIYTKIALVNACILVLNLLHHQVNSPLPNYVLNVFFKICARDKLGEPTSKDDTGKMISHGSTS